MTVVPFPLRPVEVTPELRRAAEYHEGRRLKDSEIVEVLKAEFDGILAHWTALGRWMNHLDMWKENARPKLSGKAVNNPGLEERERRSLAMRKAWARKRASGERLPSSWPHPSRIPTAETRAKMSAGQRRRWADATPNQRAQMARHRKEA
jgi:hypothetical protein